MTYCGMEIVVNDACVPKLSLSDDVLVSDAFRREMNEWLLDNFGKRYAVPDGETYVMKSGTLTAIVMNPNTRRDLALTYPEWRH